MNEKKQKTVFIDRDGTLIAETNYLARVENIRFFPYTGEAVKLLKDKGFLVIVITNQSGIGRGFLTEFTLHEIHRAIQNQLTEKIDAFYFCPHLPADKCVCRKPNLGMIEAACRDFAVDLENSWMIGDKILDIELGFNANIKTCLVKTGYGAGAAQNLARQPDLIAENILEAAKFITGTL